MRITICGVPGSGKSTVAKMVAEILEFKHYVAGDFQRKMAEESGMTILEFAKAAETDPEIDKKTDEWAAQIGQSYDNFVMVGRTAFNFIPDSFCQTGCILYLRVRQQDHKFLPTPS